MPITQMKLDSWVEADLNVLFHGNHGVGKSAIVISTFERHNLRYAYFSAATMDPWVDFVGIPTVQRSELTDAQVIKLIRPEWLEKLNPQAMFFDELNRSSKKIRNAIMELTQFKTLNGERIFPELRMIWGAVNPDADEDSDAVYDTDRLDPAQRDRFQIHVEVPFECDTAYFSNKYGRDNAKAAISWWSNIPAALRTEVSPRRLDYALDWYNKGGDLGDVLPGKTLPGNLRQHLRHGYIPDRLKGWYKENNVSDATAYFASANNFRMAQGDVLNLSFEERSWFYPLLPKENLSVLYSKQKLVREDLHKSYLDNLSHENFLQEISNSGLLDKRHIQQLKSVLKQRQKIAAVKPLSTLTNHLGNAITDAKDIHSKITQITKGNKTQLYHDAIALWKRTHLPSLKDKDLVHWYNFIGKLASGTWSTTLKQQMPELGDIIAELKSHKDLSSSHLPFRAAEKKMNA